MFNPEIKKNKEQEIADSSDIAIEQLIKQLEQKIDDPTTQGKTPEKEGATIRECWENVKEVAEKGDPKGALELFTKVSNKLLLKISPVSEDYHKLKKEGEIVRKELIKKIESSNV